MKAYTDLEQSKKLAEFLSLESADMYYDGFGRLPQGYAYTLIYPNSFEYDKPCWSLAALLEAMPNGCLIKNINGKYKVLSNSSCVINDVFNNPVDACYEMILKLHELKML